MNAGPLSPALEKNLRALATRDRALVERLLLPASSGHVILSPDAPALYQVHGSLVPLGVTGAALDAVHAALPDDASQALLFGVGLGEPLAHLLRLRPEAQLVAWERDPWLLRETLSRWDYSHSLSTGRLRLALGVDLALDLDHLASLPRAEHPALARVYHHEYALLTSARDTHAPWVAVGLGGLFVDDLAEALREEGYRVLPVELRRWSREEIEGALQRLDPALVAAINYTGGLAELCEAQGRCLLVWEVDPTPDRAPAIEGTTRRTYVFTYREAHVESFRAAGFAHVEHLPLAANPAKRRPLELDPGDRAHYASPVCFVGSSMVTQAREFRRKFLHLYASWHAGGDAAVAQADERVQQVLDAQRADYSTYRVPDLAQEHFGDFLAAARLSGTREDPVIWLGEIAAADKRLAYVAALAPHGVRVWGDEGWGEVEETGARYLGRAGHHEELTRIYSAGGVHVDINRLYQPDIVTMRVFDVLACGGFLLAERSEELEELFRLGEEIETYATLAELVEKVEHFIAHPAQAKAIAARGRAAVLERHTIEQRVRYMLSVARG